MDKALGNIKLTPIKVADYDSRKVSTIAIENFPVWTGWATKFFCSKESFYKQHVLTKDNRRAFKELFGKRHFAFSSSHFFHCWVVDLGTAKIILLTASVHGTCYEVVDTWYGAEVQKDISRVFEFLDALVDILERKVQCPKRK